MSSDKDPKLLHVSSSDSKAEREDKQPLQLELGQWYWHTYSDVASYTDTGDPVVVEKTKLVCITHLGSNYAQLTSPFNWNSRVHFDHFWDCCQYVADASTVIELEVKQHQSKVMGLLAEIHDVTASLTLGPAPALQVESSQMSLALRGSGENPQEYEKRLVKAKKEDLPELFKKVKEVNESLSCWMTALTLPLKAQTNELNTVVKQIDDRIFNVQLYAGLVEKLKMVKKGAPAAMTEKVHLMQRRHYMDEECLANYRTGGMKFKNLKAFDCWLARKENFERVLPFNRTVVAFRVRRQDKTEEYDGGSIWAYIQLLLEGDLNKTTFLYIRNGDQLFRLNTAVEFGPKLFPDFEDTRLHGKKLWADTRFDTVDKIITDDEYQDLLRREEALRAEAEVKIKADPDNAWFHQHHWFEAPNYTPYDRRSVDYDEIHSKIQGDIQLHNRIVMILQGVLDRSPALHPHPPWLLWSADGFNQALELVYDDSRALTTGTKPDFEAYRNRLNASLRAGSITVGQELAWELHEGSKESKRMDQDWRIKRGSYRPKTFRPYGDPGPGMLAEVSRYISSSKRCEYRWERERKNFNQWNDDPIAAKIVVPSTAILNVSAYTPGDYKQFFNDPRTRAEYLKWAPMLLEAEEFHAGNRKIGEKS